MKLKAIWTPLLAAGFGLLGGSTAIRLQSARAADDIVRTSRVELLDPTGKPRAILGIDNDKGEVLLSFLSRDGKTLASLGLTSDRLPALKLNGGNGKARAVLQLSDKERPLLGMSDDEWEGRVLLGAIEDDLPTATTDWGLRFTAPGGSLASIGAIRDRTSQSLSGILLVRASSGKAFKAP
jgi:hypothetical protein